MQSGHKPKQTPLPPVQPVSFLFLPGMHANVCPAGPSFSRPSRLFFCLTSCHTEQRIQANPMQTHVSVLSAAKIERGGETRPEQNRSDAPSIREEKRRRARARARERKRERESSLPFTLLFSFLQMGRWGRRQVRDGGWQAVWVFFVGGNGEGFCDTQANAVPRMRKS